MASLPPPESPAHWTPPLQLAGGRSLLATDCAPARESLLRAAAEALWPEDVGPESDDAAVDEVDDDSDLGVMTAVAQPHGIASTHVDANVRHNIDTTLLTPPKDLYMNTLLNLFYANSPSLARACKATADTIASRFLGRLHVRQLHLSRFAPDGTRVPCDRLPAAFRPPGQCVLRLLRGGPSAAEAGPFAALLLLHTAEVAAQLLPLWEDIIEYERIGVAAAAAAGASAPAASFDDWMTQRYGPDQPPLLGRLTPDGAAAVEKVRQFFSEMFGADAATRAEFVRAAAEAAVLAAARESCAAAPVPLRIHGGGARARPLPVLADVDARCADAFLQPVIAALRAGTVGSAWVPLEGTCDAHAEAATLMLRVAARAFPGEGAALAAALAAAAAAAPAALAARIEAGIFALNDRLLDEGFKLGGGGGLAPPPPTVAGGETPGAHARAAIRPERPASAAAPRAAGPPPLQLFPRLAIEAGAVVAGAAATGALLALHDAAPHLLAPACAALLSGSGRAGPAPVAAAAAAATAASAATGGGAPESRVAALIASIAEVLGAAAYGDSTRTARFVVDELERLRRGGGGDEGRVPPPRSGGADSRSDRGDHEGGDGPPLGVRALPVLGALNAVVSVAAASFCETLLQWQLQQQQQQQQQQHLSAESAAAPPRVVVAFDPSVMMAALRAALSPRRLVQPPSSPTAAWRQVDDDEDDADGDGISLRCPLVTALLNRLATMTAAAAAAAWALPVKVSRGTTDAAARGVAAGAAASAVDPSSPQPLDAADGAAASGGDTAPTVVRGLLLPLTAQMQEPPRRRGGGGADADAQLLLAAWLRDEQASWSAATHVATARRRTGVAPRASAASASSGSAAAAAARPAPHAAATSLRRAIDVASPSPSSRSVPVIAVEESPPSPAAAVTAAAPKASATVAALPPGPKASPPPPPPPPPAAVTAAAPAEAPAPRPGLGAAASDARDVIAKRVRHGGAPSVDAASGRVTVSVDCPRCTFRIDPLELAAAGGKRSSGPHLCPVCDATVGWCCESIACVRTVGLHPEAYFYAPTTKAAAGSKATAYRPSCEWCASEAAAPAAAGPAAAASLAARPSASRGRGSKRRAPSAGARPSVGGEACSIFGDDDDDEVEGAAAIADDDDEDNDSEYYRGRRAARRPPPRKRMRDVPPSSAAAWGGADAGDHDFDRIMAESLAAASSAPAVGVASAAAAAASVNSGAPAAAPPSRPQPNPRPSLVVESAPARPNPDPQSALARLRRRCPAADLDGVDEETAVVMLKSMDVEVVAPSRPAAAAAAASVAAAAAAPAPTSVLPPSAARAPSPSPQLAPALRFVDPASTRPSLVSSPGAAAAASSRPPPGPSLPSPSDEESAPSFATGTRDLTQLLDGAIREGAATRGRLDAALLAPRSDRNQRV